MKETVYIVLAIYDISDNKRRNRMVKCLREFGDRVQKSAFEAQLTKRRYLELMDRAKRLINPIEDSLRVYILDSIVDIYSWGKELERTEECIVL